MPEKPNHEKLNPEKLRKTIDPARFAFASTAEMTPIKKHLGQERAVSALTFGLGMESHGYNLFVLGQPGAGKQSTVTMVLEEKAAKGRKPDDWLYVFNFADPEKPVAINLPAGEGETFRDDMTAFVKDIVSEIPKAFADDSYNREKNEIMRLGHEKRNEAFEGLEKLANEYGFALQKTPDGITLTYTRNGEPIEPEEFQNMSAEEQEKIRKGREILQEKLHETISLVRQVDRGIKNEFTELDKKTCLEAVDREMEPLRSKYEGLTRIMEYLDAIRGDVVNFVDKFRGDGRDGPKLPFPFQTEDGPDDAIKRYVVNLLVNNKTTSAAPVVFESNPTYHNLIGRIEYRFQMGAFSTDYTMIKAGAFHRANGGYLVLNAREVLLNPFAYEALKRVLKDQEIRMEEVGEQLRLMATASLKPQPIPARLKVVLLGTPWLYYLLQEYDEDFLKLFKVKGEFADEMELNEDNILSYAYLIAGQCARENLLPFGRDAVAKIMEHGMRIAEHQNKLSTRFLEITDLVREAHHWAKDQGRQTVSAGDIDKTLKHSIYRNDYLEHLLGEMITDGSILLDVAGSVAGQINGLSVYDTGDYAFGKPSRVTARIHMGKEGVTNIERESEMGGPIHNKGVLILQGFFGARYAQKTPISFAATLCFEQSYGGVEGDSASSAELFALISAITGLPVRQDLAVTGSVNQMGQIQSVGGINLKIEGFYKTCKALGLTGSQGVVIPKSNIKNLMLDEEVVEAVKDGKFHIYPIATVDEGLELLTGIDAGKPDQYGDYPKGSVNERVVAKLERIAAQWRKMHGEE